MQIKLFEENSVAARERFHFSPQVPGVWRGFSDAAVPQSRQVMWGFSSKAGLFMGNY